MDGRLACPGSAISRRLRPPAWSWAGGFGWIVSDFPADVLTYSPDGRVRGRLGEPGQGPGEWSRPARVAADRGDSIWVSNLQGRASVFAPDGTPARTLSSPQLRSIHGFLEDGNPYSLVFRPSPEDRIQGTLLGRAWDRGPWTDRGLRP